MTPPPAFRSIRCWFTPGRQHGPIGILAAGPVNAFHANGRGRSLLRYDSVLFFDNRTRSGIAIEAPEDVAWHSAIGTQRAVFVNDIEKREFNARCRLACHFGFPVIVDAATHRARHRDVEPRPARPKSQDL